MRYDHDLGAAGQTCKTRGESCQTAAPTSVGDLDNASRTAERFLRRFNDAFTEVMREELAQETALVTLECCHTVRDRMRLAAFVRTVARRQRCLAVAEKVRLPTQSFDADPRLREQIVQPDRPATSYSVAGAWVLREDMLRALPEVFAQLDSLNVRLLMSYYEGFNCHELAERFELTSDSIKVRIHRSRLRVKRLLECKVVNETGELRDGPFRPPRRHRRRRRTEKKEN